MKKYLLFLFWLFSIGSVQSQNPRLDSSFTKNHYFLQGEGKGIAHITQTKRLADSSLLMAGFIYRSVFNAPKYGNTYDKNILLLRTLPDGQIDSSFALNGIQVLGERYTNDEALFLDTDPSKSIFIFGLYSNGQYVFKLLPSGDLDPSFGEKGKFWRNSFWSSKDNVGGLLAGKGGEVYLTGYRDDHFFLEKVNKHGNPDSTFGLQGRKEIIFPSQYIRVTDIIWQRDSLLLVSLLINNSAGKIFRFLSNGEQDSTFGQNGVVDYGPASARFTYTTPEIRMIKDNSFWIMGKSDSMHFIHAFLPDGKIDSSQFQNGSAWNQFNDAYIQDVQDIDVSPTGEILFLSLHSSQAILSKIDSSGNLDSLFGYQGQRIIQLENRGTRASSCHFLANGKIKVSGTLYPQIFTCQLSPTGSLDSIYYEKGYLTSDVKDGGHSISASRFDSISNNLFYTGTSFYGQVGQSTIGEFKGFLGKIIPDVPAKIDYGQISAPFSSFISDLSISHDNKIFITGFELNSSQLQSLNRMLLYKMNSPSERDSSFGNNGLVSAPIQSPFPSESIGIKVLEKSNKAILVACDMISPSNLHTSTGIFQFTTTGALDTTFNNKGVFREEYPNFNIDVTDMILLDKEDILLSSIIPFLKRIQLIRLGADGKKIKNFGDKGVLEIEVSSNPSATVSGVKLAQRQNGKLLIGGSVDGEIFLIQLLSDGNYDSTFGSNGIVKISHPDYALFGEDLVLLKNGKVLIAGTGQKEITHNSFKKTVMVVCLRPDAQLENSFGDNGFFLYTMKHSDTHIFDLELTSQGDFYLSGTINGRGLILHCLNDLSLSFQNEIHPNNLTSPLLYPNPIKHSAHLKFELTFPQEIEINLLDLSGRKLTKLASGSRPSGTNKEALVFPPHLPKGWLIIQLKTEEGTSFIKALHQ